jgi:hypothetical protein
MEIVEGELRTWNKLLPPRWGDISLVGHEGEVASWFEAIVSRDFEPTGEEVILARKLGRGARPLSLLGLPERLVYRGAVLLVAAESGAPDRSSEAYRAFRQGPLQVADCKYVFKTDINSYYQYVDHERLVDEVVAQTGGYLEAMTITELLRAVTGRSYGIPQLSLMSDILADIYIEPMRRTLLRGGFDARRYADDFLVPCMNYSEALAAWETADHAARDLGLVLNELKTTTPGIAVYAASLSAVADREGELFRRLDVDTLPDFESDYMEFEGDGQEPNSLLPSLLGEEDETEVVAHEGTEDDTLVTEAQVEAAHKVVSHWLEEDEDDDSQRQESAKVTAALLGRALVVFAKASDLRPLTNVTSMLIYEPSLTPTIARYISSCASVDRKAALQALDDICGSDAMSPWQSIWIAAVAGSIPGGRTRATSPHVVWLQHQMTSPHDALAAEATFALARRRLATVKAVNAVVHRLSDVHRPTGLLALAVLSERQALSSSESLLDRFRAEWAASRF